MPRHRWWIAPLFLLQACAEPRFEFRGYSDLSGCTDVLDAELANGAGYEGVFDSDEPGSPAQTIELSGEIFDQRVRIDVTCTAGRIDRIQYISPARDPMETGALFVAFAEKLQALFGEPTVITTNVVRSLRYLCHSPSPVLLEEWILEADREDEAQDPAQDEAPEHEVYIAVVPGAAECLAAAD